MISEIKQEGGAQSSSTIDLRKFKLFFGDRFYPLPAYEDFIGNFETIEAAKEYVEKQNVYGECKWAQIVFDDTIVVTGETDWDKDMTVEWKYIK